MTLGLLLALSSPTFAQSQGASEAAIATARFLHEQQKAPVEPTGFPSPPPREGSLPPDLTAPDDRQVRILEAQEIHRSGNLLRVLGPVRLLYRGYEISGDMVEGNLDTEEFEATGNVKVRGADALVEGVRVRVNARDRSYRAWDTESQLEASLLKGQFLDPLYVRAKESFGTRREIIALHSDSTSCNYDEPHYHVDAEHATIRPGVRAIFRKLRVIVLGRTILKLPYLSVPLSEPTYRYIPEFGKNEQDGYYVKTRYGIPLRGENHFDSRVDWFEKRGTAVGGDYNYLGRALAGVLTLYALTGDNSTYNVNSRHEQRLGWGTLNIDSSYQENNFLNSPVNSTLLSNRMLLTIPQGQNLSRVSVYRTEQETGGFTSEQRTYTLDDARRWSQNTRTNLGVSWVQAESGDTNREQVDVRFTGEHDLKRALARFEYQRSIPVGDIDNFFSASDRTPVIALSSDARRLLGSRAPANLPFTTELSVGEYVDALSRDHVTRSSLDLQFQRPDRSRGRTLLSVNGRFRQGIYSDDTAQYLLALGSQFSYRFGAATSLNVRYNYLRPYGFSPLTIDQTGKTNLITVDLSYRPFRPLLIGTQFWISTRKFNFDQVGTLVAGFIMIGLGVLTSGLTPSLLQWLGYLVLTLSSLAIFYALNLILMTTGIWLVRVENLWVLGESLVQVARYPLDIYGTGLQRVFTYVVPLAFISTVPSRQLVRGFDPTMVGLGVTWAVCVFFAARLFWNFALTHYGSASS